LPRLVRLRSMLWLGPFSTAAQIDLLDGRVATVFTGALDHFCKAYTIIQGSHWTNLFASLC
jgi:hypothetical protein